MTLYARVAVPRPIHRTFLYRVPDELVTHVSAGHRAVVPFGRRELVGWVDEVVRDPTSLPTGLRDIVDLPDREPVLDSGLLELCRWTAEYYAAPLGLTFRAATPSALTSESAVRLALTSETPEPEDLSRSDRDLLEFLEGHAGPVKLSTVRKNLGSGHWAGVARELAERGLVELERERPSVEPSVQSRQVLRLKRAIPSLRQRDRIFGRAGRQRELFEYLESVGGSAEVVHLERQLGISRSVAHGLVDKGLAVIRDEQIARDPLADLEIPPDAAHEPTAAQTDAIRRVLSAADRRPPGVCLLRGVTSSGKTLVYIEVLRELVAGRGRGAILLVPEIALTPQTLNRFRAAFGDDVALFHSGLSDSERYETWQALRSGDRRIVIGARSAVFAPVPDLGAIILDEEHETSYKQSDAAPRYNAREVAIVRARRAGAVCVLGSATPSLESWANARSGKWELLELPERIGARPLPSVRVVDLRGARKNGGRPVVLSDDLRNAVAERLERGEQAILLLNRRGYASFLQCRNCGALRLCWQCNVSLTYHRRPARLVCHHCGHEERVPTVCPECGSENLSDRGLGTEQVERVLEELFPRARIARMDVDTTSGKWSHHEILKRVERGTVDILFGTQMIAKGLDFPNVTLAGVVNADVGLGLPDFRASERTFQLLTQLAGRAGRGVSPGEVIIQTALPEHYSIRFAVSHDYQGFAAREIDERAAPRYPPHNRLANIVLSGRGDTEVLEAAQAAAEWLEGLFSAHGIDQVRLLGPAPCPIDRIRGRWRWHILLKAEGATALGQVLQYFARRFDVAASVRAEIDRDPVSLL